MRGLNNPFPAPGADDVLRRFGLGPPFAPSQGGAREVRDRIALLLLREEVT